MNMMFPKPTKQKKRKKHKKSIMQPKGDRRCYLCMLLDGDFTYKPYLEEHHALFGNTHAFAEAEGLKVNLCLEHHRNGPAAVHNNAKNQERADPDGESPGSVRKNPYKGRMDEKRRKELFIGTTGS